MGFFWRMAAEGAARRYLEDAGYEYGKLRLQNPDADDFELMVKLWMSFFLNPGTTLFITVDLLVLPYGCLPPPEGARMLCYYICVHRIPHFEETSLFQDLVRGMSEVGSLCQAHNMDELNTRFQRYNLHSYKKWVAQDGKPPFTNDYVKSLAKQFRLLWLATIRSDR